MDAESAVVRSQVDCEDVFSRSPFLDELVLLHLKHPTVHDWTLLPPVAFHHVSSDGANRNQPRRCFFI
jgi:hypothetical protein